MSALVLIPARMASTRLPGKPLADLSGRPMIVHVADRAVQAGAGRVVVATDSEEIATAVRAFGHESVMTRPDHPSGSDRVHEALGLVDPDGDHETVINLQGDLPLVPPELIESVADALHKSGADIATLAARIVDPGEVTDPNVVKIVATLSEGDHLRALYFTRAPAPWGEGPHLHHIGIYAFRRSALDRFVALPASPLERRERLEQLRALEAGMHIAIAMVGHVPVGVDTPEDLARVRAMLSEGPAQ